MTLRSILAAVTPVVTGVVLALATSCTAAVSPPREGGALPGEPARPGDPPAAAAAEVPAPPEAPLTLPPAPAAVIRQLPSGARVAIVERRDIPRVAVRLVVDAGTSADGEHAGAALVAAHAVAATLTERAAKLGADVEVSVGPDAAVLGIAVHPADADAAIALLADAVRGGRPGPAEVQKVRARLAAESRRAAAEDDAHAASFVIVRDLYDLPTARHPYGTTSPTGEEIAIVTPADVRNLVTARYLPSAASMAIVGDVGASAADAAVERALGRGPARPPPGLGLTEPFARDRDRVTVVDRPRVDDGHVFVGLAAPPAENEAAAVASEIALQVAAARLGPAASTRMHRFREGPQIGELSLRAVPSNAAASVRRVLDELDRMAETAPTEREVTAAQRALVAVEARSLASVDGVADRLADALARGAGEDPIGRRLRVLGDMTGPIVSIAARALSEAPAHVVVVGSADRLGPELVELAEVKIVDPLTGYARVRSLPRVPR